MSRLRFFLIIVFCCFLVLSFNRKLQAEVQTISLYQGWNLISFQIDPLDPNVGTLPSLLFHPDTKKNDPDAFICVWGFDSQTNSWQTYQQDYPVLNNIGGKSLEKIESKKGYWIKVARNVDLTIEGAIAGGSIHFDQGWNLVGFIVSPTGENETLSIEQVLGPHITYIDQIWMLDANNSQGYKGYNPQADPPIQDFDHFEEGFGYWVYAKESFIFSPVMKDCYIYQYCFNGVDNGIQEGKCTTEDGELPLKLVTNVGSTLSGISVSGDMKLSIGILMY